MVVKALLWFLGRPLFLPLFTCAVGFWYGTFDLCFTIAGTLIQSPDPKKLPVFYKFLTYTGGIVTGSSMILIRHFMMKPPESFLAVIDNKEPLNVTTIINRFKNNLKTLRSFPVRYYALTVVGSASIAGVATAILQKNVDIKKYNKKLSHIVPKTLLTTPGNIVSSDSDTSSPSVNDNSNNSNNDTDNK